MIMNPKHLFFIAFLPVLAWAQEPLTISQAMRDATANHPLLKAAEARAQSAHAQARQARGYRLPSIDVSESFIRTGNPAEAFAFQMNQERFSMAEFANPAQDPNNPDLLNTFMTRIEATLPVFTGGMLHARNLQAARMARAADSELTRTRESVALDAVTAWLNLSKAREFRDLMRRSLATSMAHQQRAKEYFDQGMLAPSDILRAEVFVAEMRDHAARADQQEELAQAALNYQRGRPQNEPVLLAVQDSAVERSVDAVNAVELACNLRPDLLAAHDKLDAGKAEVIVARSTFLPQIGVVARYDWYDDQLFGNHGASWAIVGQAKINLFRGGADRNAWKKAYHDAQAGKHDVQRFEEGVELEVRQSLAERSSAALRYDAALTALSSGRENLRVVEARYAQGVAQMTDLLDAQTALRELEVRELTARYDKQLAEYQIRFVTGQSLLSE